jgi:hypothetical protein
VLFRNDSTEQVVRFDSIDDRPSSLYGLTNLAAVQGKNRQASDQTVASIHIANSGYAVDQLHLVFRH